MLHNCIDTVDLLECNGSNTILTQDMNMVKHYSETLGIWVGHELDNGKSIQTMPLETSSSGLKKLYKSLKTLKKIHKWRR